MTIGHLGFIDLHGIAIKAGHGSCSMVGKNNKQDKAYLG